MKTVKPILVITGPTASGKSALAAEAARLLDGEVLSCDALQVYRGMDIGTAKIGKDEMRGVPHRLISVVSPHEPFSAGRFRELCDAALERLFHEGKTPVLCGGTCMYIDAVLFDMPLGGVQGSADIREQLKKELAEQGAAAMHARLAGLDPESAAALHPNDTLRVLRALEIVLACGVKKSDLKTDYRRAPRYPYIYIVLSTDRETLYRRIDARVDGMMQAGLLAEVEALKSQNLPKTATAAKAIGYKELFDYLDGLCTLEDAVSRIKQGTRNYCKRQLTWLRKVPDAIWLDANDPNAVHKAAKLYREKVAGMQ